MTIIQNRESKPTTHDICDYKPTQPDADDTVRYLSMRILLLSQVYSFAAVSPYSGSAVMATS